MPYWRPWQPFSDCYPALNTTNKPRCHFVLPLQLPYLTSPALQTTLLSAVAMPFCLAPHALPFWLPPCRVILAQPGKQPVAYIPRFAVTIFAACRLLHALSDLTLQIRTPFCLSLQSVATPAAGIVRPCNTPLSMSLPSPRRSASSNAHPPVATPGACLVSDPSKIPCCLYPPLAVCSRETPQGHT
jgi:hypothetical protein